MPTTRPGDNFQHSHDLNSHAHQNLRHQSVGLLKRFRSLKRVSTLVAALVAVGVVAAGFMVVSGRAAALGFHLPASIAKIFASKTTARTAAAPQVLSAPASTPASEIGPLAPAATSIAGWGFEGVTTNNTGTTPTVSVGSATADTGAQTGGSSFTALHASAVTVWSNPAGNGSAKSVSSNFWGVGDYYQFLFNTTGYNGISITWDQTGSGTGPRDFKVQYSTNGTTFTDATGTNSTYQLLLSDWAAGTPHPAHTRTLDLSGVAALNNQATVYIRLVDTSTTNINAGAVATAGTDRVDNFTVNGTANANQTASVINSPQPYSGVTQPANVTCSGGGTASNIKYNTSLTLPTNAGTYAVTANCPAATNFNPGTDLPAGNFEISKATAVVTFNAAPTPTFPGSNFTVSATTTNTDSSTLTYSYVSGPCTFVSGATFTPTGTGTCVVQADGATSTNFTTATAQQSVTIVAPPETSVAVSGGNLTLTDGNGGTSNDTLTLSLNGSNVRANDPSNTLSAGAGATQVDANTVDVPFASITGNIQVNTLGGNDTLTLNFAGGNLLPPGGLSYDGGLQTSTPGDRLVITGGSQGTVTYNYTNAHDGNIMMSNFGTVTYTGLEPITNDGDSTNVIFNLPAGPNAITLGDDGISNTLSRLSGATIETTDFDNPTGSLTINRGNAADTMTVNALPDFNASLTIGSGANPFTTITVSGTVTVGGAAAISLAGGEVTGAGGISTGGGLTVNNTGTASTLSGIISGGALTKQGVGTLVLSNANTYTGNTISGGVLSVGVIADSGTSNLGLSGTVQFLNGATLQYTGAGANTTTRSFNAFSASGQIDIQNSTGSLDLSGAFSGLFTNTLTKLGPGTLTLSGSSDNGSLILDAEAGTVLLAKSSGVAHAVAGISSIAAGATVALGGTGGDQIFNGGFQIPFGLVNLNGGTLDLTGLNETIDRLTGATGTVTNSVSSTTSLLTIGAADGSGSFGGAINNGSGTVSLTKVGSGTEAFTGVNNYTGATSVNAGRLNINGSITSNVTVNSTGTLGGTGTINSANTVTVSGGTLAPGTSPGILNTGSVTFNSSSTFSVEIGGTTPGNTATNHDQLNVTGSVSLNNATLSLSSFGGFTPTAGQSFVIINNDSTDPITTTFAGLAEGATIPNFLGSGLSATITYAGGTNSNDVVLSLAAPCTPPSTVYVDDNWVGTAPGTDPDGIGPATNFGCDSFATIQGGINAVTAGGTVIVNDGTYIENVTIPKALTLTGAGAATVTLRPAISDPNCGGGGGGSLCGVSNLILVQANNVTISGMTLDGDNPGLPGGINVGGANVDARNGIITDHNTGIFENLVVHHVTVKNVFLRGIYASSGGSFNFHHNMVQNVAGDVNSSIAMFNFGGVGTFDNNTVLDSNDGIASNASLGTQYTNNHVSNCASGGIHTDNAGDGPIVSNDLISANIVDNSPLGGFGIYAYEPRATVTIQNNTVTNVDNGLASFGRLPSTGSLPSGNIKEGAAQSGGSATARPRVIDVREPGAVFLKQRAVRPNTPADVSPDATVFTGNTVNGQNKANSTGVTLTTDQLGNGSGSAGITLNQNTVIANVTGFKLEAQPTFTLTVKAAFNRLVATTIAFNTINNTGTLSATMENNWWGCNAGPGNIGCGAISGTGVGVDFNPWIVLGVSALPSSIPPFTNSTITADMTKNSNGAPAGGTLPDIPVAWSAVNGTMSPTNGTVVASTASSTFTSTSTSSGSACAMVDNQLTCANVTIFPTTVTIVPAPTPTAADNDYTRINNAVQATFNGQTIKLLGTFNWTEPFAAASWSRGSNDIGGDLDDYSILVPANLNNVTFTADNLGDGTIQGPGDLPGLDLEGVFFFNGGDNQNWTISNIQFLDFDLAIGMFQGAGGVDAFNNTHITNNYIRMARDVAGPTDTAQNIAIYYSFGTNQVINGNTIDIQGDAVTVGGNNAADVGMQCDMSGGNVYNNLQITNNTIHVLNAQSANPEVIIGIWENAHAHTSNITVSGNTFTNQGVGNSPATNLQSGFRVTSHSSATTAVTYQNNTVSGANMGFQWLAGSDFSGNLPVVVKSNTITGNNTGVKVDSQGSANLSFNRIVGNTTAGLNNASGTVTAENNWWGCNAGPGFAGCDAVTGVADFDPWLVLGVSAVPSSMNPGGTSTVTADMRFNSDAADTSGDGTLPLIPVAFTATQGTMTPPTSTITASQAVSTFTSTSGSSGTACAMVDNQQICTPITVNAPAFTINDVTHNEGNGPGTTAYTFTITKTGATALNASVDYATVNGSATEPSDFTAITTTNVAFRPGETTKQFTVLVNGDITFETNEAFTVHLSNAVNAAIADADGTGTITNDDAQPTLSINNVSLPEGNLGSTDFAFTVTKAGNATELPVSVTFATADGLHNGSNTGATGGAVCGTGTDYESQSGLLTFLPNETTMTIHVPVCGDPNYENNELFFVNLVTPTGATIISNPGTGTIQNDDPVTTLSIDDVSMFEGDSGTTNFVFTVTKTGATEFTTTVHAQTANGSATEPSDFTAIADQTLTFPPSASTDTQTVTVVVNGDTTNESDELFFVSLFNVTNATIGHNPGTGTIQNDDARTISGRVTYADPGTPVKNTTMTLSAPSFTTQVTVTDVNGDYSFTNVPVGNNYTVTPSKPGDANNIESFDAAKVARFVAGLDVPTANQVIASDADNDGILTSFDAVLIARYVAGLPNTGIVGTWKFVPVNHTYTAFAANQTNQNFTAILVGETSGNWVATIVFGDGDDARVAPQSPDTTLAVTVSLPHVTGPMLSTITVPITVGDLTGQGVKAYDLQVSFNPAIVIPDPTPTDTAGTLSSTMLITPNTMNPGHLIVSAFQTLDLAGSGTLIKLRFTIIGAPGQVTATTFQDFTDPGTIFHPGFRFNAGTPAAVTTNGSIHVNGPTAAAGAVSGRVTDEAGRPVSGVVITLNGTQSRKTITDADGNYRFDDVETGGFYTVTPSRANFGFSPGQRSFSQVGNHTDAVFTAVATGTNANPLDTTEYFVRQQYLDFLGREPDEAGFNYWVNNIAVCGADSNCRSAKRTDTSAAFFLSIEFQQTGYLVYRMYQSAYGDMPGTPVPLNLSEFRPGRQAIGEGVIVNQSGWEAKLESNTQAFASEFVQRSRFTNLYPTTMSPAEFVDSLFRNGGVTPDGSDRAAAINEFGGMADTANAAARARAVRLVAENATLRTQKFSQAFVLMQYFGYLGRDPNAAPDTDFSGYNFWLNKLDSFNGDFRQAEMVKAFLVAGEYRGRFPR